MANVLQSPVDFHLRPITHSPKPLGFGFGLPSSSSNSMVSSASGWHANPAPTHFHHLTTNYTPTNFNQAAPSRLQKRRHEPDENAESAPGDEAMDRSPTPERVKRGQPKRVRVNPVAVKEEKTAKENKAPESEDSDVDIGLLLASLPTQSLLPLLSSLMTAHPALKTTILPLIPRPTVDMAIQAIVASAKKLSDAYPYSSSSSFQSPAATVSFGFGSGSNTTTRPDSFLSSTFGFGNRPAFGQNSVSTFGQHTPTSQHNGGMRDSYIQSRIRPHITEFVSTCMSYLPYFSYIAQETGMSQPSSSAHQSHSSTLQALNKDKCHPSETYLFLAALTRQVLSQPPLTQSALAPLLLSRLVKEWEAWVDRVDQTVNKDGGMFGGETVGGWMRGLDDSAQAGNEWGEAMRAVRDQWVTKAGWLVGRSEQQPMEEL